MIPKPGEDDWGFGPVFDLIHSLSISGGEHTHQKKVSSDTDSDSPERAAYTATIQVHDQEAAQLGDFDKIWQYLGQPLDLPPPAFAAGSSPDFIDVWDGQTAGEQRSLKVVRWQDGIEYADKDENNAILDLSNLTKQQRKKVRRKQRLQDREALATQPTNRKSLPSSSEDDSGKDVQEQKPLDRSGVIYQLLHGTPPPPVTGRLRSGKLFRKQDPNDAGALPTVTLPSSNNVVQILQPVGESALEVAAAKKRKLISLLHDNFVDDRQYLNNLSFTQISTNSTDAVAEGIHVFVDASNVCYNNSDILYSIR